MPLPEYPSGLYTFTFAIASFYFETTIELIEPDMPQLILVAENENSYILLYHFSPYEKVRLLVYRYENNTPYYPLLMWQEFIVDVSGNAIVKTDVGLLPDGSYSSEYIYAAIGNLSGITYYKKLGWFPSDIVGLWRGSQVYCIGAPNPIDDIKLGSTVTIISENAFVRERTNPFGEPMKYEDIPIGKDTYWQIKGPPTCEDGAYWWEVTCTDCPPTLSEFRIAEQLYGEQYIQPVDNGIQP